MPVHPPVETVSVGTIVHQRPATGTGAIVSLSAVPGKIYVLDWILLFTSIQTQITIAHANLVNDFRLPDANPKLLRFPGGLYVGENTAFAVVIVGTAGLENSVTLKYR